LRLAVCNGHSFARYKQAREAASTDLAAAAAHITLLL
jgi:hypothetical protein